MIEPVVEEGEAKLSKLEDRHSLQVSRYIKDSSIDICGKLKIPSISINTYAGNEGFVVSTNPPVIAIGDQLVNNLEKAANLKEWNIFSYARLLLSGISLDRTLAHEIYHIKDALEHPDRTIRMGDVQTKKIHSQVLSGRSEKAAEIFALKFLKEHYGDFQKLQWLISIQVLKIKMDDFVTGYL